jgi:hypothetical protein
MAVNDVEGCMLMIHSPEDRRYPGRSAAKQSRRNESELTTRRPAQCLIIVINGVLVGVGSVYVMTTSVLVTTVAAIAAVLLAMVIVLTHR